MGEFGIEKVIVLGLKVKDYIGVQAEVEVLLDDLIKQAREQGYKIKITRIKGRGKG